MTWFAKDADALAQSGISLSSLGTSGNEVTGAVADATFEATSCADRLNPSSQCTGCYLLDIRTRFVPGPATALTLSLGTLILGVISRQRREHSTSARK